MGPAYIELTAADDGLSHRVAQEVYDRCVAEGRGQYLNLCRRHGDDHEARARVPGLPPRRQGRGVAQ